MAKRRTSDSDNGSDASEDEATPSKRVRLEAEAPQGEVDSGETTEDRQLEAKYGDQIRAAIAKGDQIKGRVAQSGIIQRIEMHQFMCHPRLHFDFGPQVNFIVGNNGSGKSAVLSAITVALGGKATSTGRGSGLKSFIREGQNQSEVIITIKNEGEDAYKPEVYGSSIIITRRFSKDGTGSYKIKSKAGKVISTTKAELSAICDHMNIQVDNPLNILSQDSARQFLSSSHPRDKYEFFLKGTQLQQLSEEYAVCLQNITNQSNVIKTKEEALPILEEARKQAKARYQAAQKAVETRMKISNLKREMAWSHVKAKEEEMRAKIEEAAKVGRKIPRIKKSAENAQASLDIANQDVTALETELEELGNMDELNQTKGQVQSEISSNKEELRELASNMKRMDDDIKRTTAVIRQLEERIKEESAKLEADKQAEREEREGKMEETKRGIEELESSSLAIEGRVRSLGEQLDQGERRKETAEGKKEEYEREMAECYDQLGRLQSQSRNRLDAYGKNLSQVREQISSLRWHGQVPIGPIGDFFALNDQKWAKVMRIHIGRVASAFAITDARDKVQLKKLLSATGNFHIQIFVSEVDLFDYSSGEPPQNYLTVLRALAFKDEYIKRILINSSRIERIILADHRREGEEFVNSLPNGGTAWTADMYRVIAYGDGGNSSNPVDQLHPKDPRNLLFIDNNIANEIQTWKERGKQADMNMKAAVETIKAASAELARLRDEKRNLERESSTIKGRLRSLRRVRDLLIEQHNEDVPVNIGALQIEKQVQEEDKQQILTQYEHALASKNAINEKQVPLMKQMEEIREKIATFESQKSEITSRITVAVTKRVEAQNSLSHWEGKLREEEKNATTLDAAVIGLQAEYEDWAKKAEDYCDGIRFDSPRKKDELERLITSSEKALKDQEKAQGATTEELEARLREADKKYTEAKKDLKDLSTLQKLLKSSMNDRMDRWHEFRRHIALRTKIMFQYLLANRAYYGKVLFDHENQKLDLKVQTDDQAATQGLNKDPKSLSGGEKSFATICLLLALWQAIGCPIRCLDEFDVFMDAINRRISLKMLIDTANSSDSKQYILITPQDMSGIDRGPSVRVHRMQDPERGQNPLNF